MKEILRTLEMNNEEDTRAFGLELAKEAKAGDVIALVGDLGTGKTALTRYIAEGLGIKGRISSPTFTIVKEYSDGRLPLYHFDVYRLEETGDAVDELYNIGADEYFEGRGVSVIEWADLIYEALPEDTKYIFIEYGDTEEKRIYKCTF